MFDSKTQCGYVDALFEFFDSMRGNTMVQRKPAAKAATRKPAATTKRAATKATAPAVKGERDVTQYADKEPTGLHKALANFIVTEAGYNPNDAGTKREAFLMGVSIATAIRPVFQSSQFLADWYEETGTPKRGRKPKDADAEEETTRKSKRAQVSDDEFEDAAEDEAEEDTDEVEEVDLDELEEELNSLAIGPLRKTAKEDYELTLTRGMTKAEIVNAILAEVEAQSEEDDEDDEEDEGGYDLEELQEELEDMTIADLKERASEEFDITPKRGEKKAALIDRILASLEDDEDDEEDEEPEEEEVEEAPARGRKTAAPAKGRPAKASKEFLF